MSFHITIVILTMSRGNCWRKSAENIRKTDGWERKRTGKRGEQDRVMCGSESGRIGGKEGDRDERERFCAGTQNISPRTFES